MWQFIIGALIGYWLGYADGRWGKPPEPLKGTYEHPDMDDRAEDYGDDWE